MTFSGEILVESVPCLLLLYTQFLKKTLSGWGGWKRKNIHEVVFTYMQKYK